MNLQKNRIVITGCNGYIGQFLASFLQSKQYNVVGLVRRKNTDLKIQQFVWDSENQIIEKGAFQNNDILIHLAGAPISGGIWTKKRKEELWSSRIDTLAFIDQYLSENNIILNKVISASGINIFPFSNQIFDEQSSAGTHFIGKLCKQWEQQVIDFKSTKSYQIVRTPIVIGKNAPFVKTVQQSIIGSFAFVIGNGKQNIEWIAVNDLVKYYEIAINKENNSVYHAVNPNSVDYNTIVKKISSKPNLKLIHLPKLLLAPLGELGELITEGVKVKNSNLLSDGFTDLTIAMTI